MATKNPEQVAAEKAEAEKAAAEKLAAEKAAMDAARKKPNSITRGSRNLWPILLVVACTGVYERSADTVAPLEVGRPAEVETAKARALAAEIVAGDHDAYLFELLSLEFGHAHRDAVISACQARAAKLKLDGVPADPRTG